MWYLPYLTLLAKRRVEDIIINSLPKKCDKMKSSINREKVSLFHLEERIADIGSLSDTDCRKIAVRILEIIFQADGA